MKLSIRSLGKVESADIDLDGVTVIVGANDSGKSTIGKALFALGTAFEDFNHRIEEDLEATIENNLYEYFDSDDHINSSDMRLSSIQIQSRKVIKSWADDLVQSLRGHANPDTVASCLEEFLFPQEREPAGDCTDSQTGTTPQAEVRKKIQETSNAIAAVLDVADEAYAQRFAAQTFNSMFGGQVTSRLIGTADTGEVSLGDGEKVTTYVRFQRTETGRETIQGIQAQLPSETRMVMIDDPRLMDDVFRFRPPSHLPRRYYRSRLSNLGRNTHDSEMQALARLVYDRDEGKQELTATDSILAERKSQGMLSRFSQGFDGRLQDKEGEMVVMSNLAVSEPIREDNASMGSKTMLFLRYLVEENKLREGDFLILDEPEIHLHPDWQLTYARFVVGLAKNLGIRVLITTHSPYFLQSMINYAYVEDFEGQTKIYGSTVSESGAATFSRLNDAGLADFFQEMTEPFYALQDEVQKHFLGKDDHDSQA